MFKLLLAVEFLIGMSLGRVAEDFYEKIDRIKLSDIWGKKNRIVSLSQRKFKPWFFRANRYFRLTGWKQYNIATGEPEPLPTRFLGGEYKSIVDISNRRYACQNPINFDFYGGYCPFNCAYCFVLNYSASIYAAFYDDYNPLATQKASHEYVRKHLPRILSGKEGNPEIRKAMKWRYPAKLGTRNEDFSPVEKVHGVTKLALDIFREHGQALVINTKSDLVLEPEYFKRITELPAAVIQVTVTTWDDKLSKLVEPGAPPISRRLEVLKVFQDVGIRVVARGEPLLFGIRGSPDEDMERYLDRLSDYGIKHLMMDTYSATAYSERIREVFLERGLDYDYLFDSQTTYQETGALYLAKVKREAQKRGIWARTEYVLQNLFLEAWELERRGLEDFPCCGIEDIWGKYNRASVTTMLIKLYKNGKLTLGEFEKMIGRSYLSGKHERDFRVVWNLENPGYPWNPDWGTGVRPSGVDSNGNIIYRVDFRDDWYLTTLEEIIRCKEEGIRCG